MIIDLWYENKQIVFFSKTLVNYEFKITSNFFFLLYIMNYILCNIFTLFIVLFNDTKLLENSIIYYILIYLPSLLMIFNNIFLLFLFKNLKLTITSLLFFYAICLNSFYYKLKTFYKFKEKFIIYSLNIYKSFKNFKYSKKFFSMEYVLEFF